MSCQRFLKRIADHAAGGQADRALLTHLESCKGCARELARERQLLARVDEELTSWLGKEPPTRWLEQVRRELTSTSPPRTGLFHPWLMPALSAGVLGIAILVLLLLWRGQRPIEGVTEEALVQPLVAEAARTLETQPTESVPTPSTAASPPAQVPAAPRDSLASDDLQPRESEPAPGVLVPQQQQLAFLRFARAAQEGLVAEEAWRSGAAVPLADKVTPLPRPSLVSFPAVEVEPLPEPKALDITDPETKRRLS